MPGLDQPRGAAIDLTRASAQLLEALGHPTDLRVRRVRLDDPDKDRIQAEFSAQGACDACRAPRRLRVVDAADDSTARNSSSGPFT
jgi:hypothetical protein